MWAGREEGLVSLLPWLAGTVYVGRQGGRTGSLPWLAGTLCGQAGRTGQFLVWQVSV